MARPICKFVGLGRDYLDVRVPLLWEDAPTWFESAVSDEIAEFEPRGSSGYRQGLKAVQPLSAGTVSLVGDHPLALGWAMLSCSGSSAQWGWERTKQDFSVQQANRVDVALDFLCSQRAFDKMHKELTALAMAHGVRPHPVGAPQWGRTLYVNWTGGKEGLEATPNVKMPNVTGVLYEKGKQLGADPDWRRFEMRHRPDKPVYKEKVFQMEPQELLGRSKWARAFLQSIGYNEAVRPERASPWAAQGPVNDDARIAKKMCTLAFMGEQYGKSVRDLVDLVGEQEARRLVELALFRGEPDEKAVEERNARSGPEILRTMAQQRWADVFADDLSRRQYMKGRGGHLH